MKKKIDNDEEKVERKKVEDEAHWSIKRILIFTSILLTLAFAVWYFFQLRQGEILGEQDMSTDGSGPQIGLPSQDDVSAILESAEENISNIDTNDIISSQPQIQQAIEQLEKLTDKDNFKKNICSSICSD